MKENALQTKNRIDWIDLARGVGVLLVIFGHTKIPYFAAYLSYAFHIPLFFMISGICFKVNDVSFFDFLVKKIKTIIIPYIFCSFIILINLTLNDTLANGFSSAVLIDNCKKLIVQRHYQTVWFLACLFICEILAYFILKYIKIKPIVLGVAVLLFGISFLYSKYYGDIALPWAIDLVPATLPFLLIGYTFKDYLKTLDIKFKFPIMLICLMMSLVCNSVNIKMFDIRQVNMFFNIYGNYVLFVLSSLSGSVAVIGLAQIISKVWAVNYIGANSIPFFAFHQTLFYIINQLLGKPEFGRRLYLTAYWFVIIVAVILVIYPFNELLIRTRLCVLIGKSKPIKKQ
ncbi:MAG: acyltransferase family protein [Eubacterium sp.]|nr:acyltransferase family protein [Eubacterium sp.]